MRARSGALALTALAAGCAAPAPRPASGKAAAGAAGEENPVADPLKPPVAERRPHVTQIHGDAVRDDWYWMRDREDPALIPYLEAEND